MFWFLCFRYTVVTWWKHCSRDILVCSLKSYHCWTLDKIVFWLSSGVIIDNFVYGRHDATWQPRSRNPQDWDLGWLEVTSWKKESLAFIDAAVQLLHVSNAVCWCTVLLEQSRYQTLCVSLTAVWRHYDVMKQHQEVTKRYHQNFMLCNNNKTTACIADLFNSCCEEDVYLQQFPSYSNHNCKKSSFLRTPPVGATAPRCDAGAGWVCEWHGRVWRGIGGAESARAM